MKILLLIISLLSFSSCQIHISLNEKNYYPFGELNFLLNQYFTALTEMQQFNGVVMVKSNDKILLHKAFNMTGHNIDTLNVNKNSQFDIRSVSKLMAKAMAYELQNQNLLSTTDNINTHFPNVLFTDHKAGLITIEHLIHNQSGYPRELKENIDLSQLDPKDIVSLISKEVLEFTPGTDDRYSNLGFQLLYSLLGNINNSSFEKNLNRMFFEPLNMSKTGSHFYATRGNLTNYASGHKFNDNNFEEVELINPETFRPGKIYATATDLMKFLQHLSSRTYKNALINKDNGKISHAGGTDGKRAYVENDTKNNYQFAFLTNTDNIPFSQIITDIRAILEKKPYQVPKKVNRKSMHIPIHILKQYQGIYEFAEISHLKLQINLENDRLAIYQDGEKSDDLNAESETIFFTESTSSESFEFIPNGDHFQLKMDWRGTTWTGEYVK